MEKTLRFAILGAGFWSRFQLAGWQELSGADCVAIYNRTRAKAERLAQDFGVPAVYDDAEDLLRQEKPDFIDIITGPDSHAEFVELAARYRIPVICQKPMAPSLQEAERMVHICRDAGVPFIIHENARWQTPIRQVKHLLEGGYIGSPFRAHIHFNCSFPVFDNQPFLRDLTQFILTDVGSHTLDIARFLFGEADRLFCMIKRIRPDIRGEDVATVVLDMGGVTCICEMSYASRLRQEHFPDHYILVEGERGSIDLGADYWIHLTTAEGTSSAQHRPHHYSWADPDYDVLHESIVECNRNILNALRTGERAETDAEDNIKTMRLVFGAYESASCGQVVTMR